VPELIPVTTTRIGEHLPLLDLLPHPDSFSWVRREDGLVGWGTHATTTVRGENRFAQAREWWHNQLGKLAIKDFVHDTGTGPILFSSFSFSSAEESVLVIPKVIVGMRAEKSWITWIGDQPQPELLEEPAHLTPMKYAWQDGTLTQLKQSKKEQLIKSF
jgi:menaquinone-specific isochorismate synthase